MRSSLLPIPTARPLMVILDDEPRILSSLARLLRHDPLELLTTEDPNLALEWIRTREVTLVMADYRMPVLDGILFLEAVREISPSTFRFLITGYPGESVVLKCLKEGLLELIAKPWDNDRLRRSILQRLGEAEARAAKGAGPPSPLKRRQG